MSLINQMLKDLEKRTQPDIKQVAAVAGVSAVPIRRKKTKYNWQLFAFSSVIVVCLLILSIKLFSVMMSAKKIHSTPSSIQPQAKQVTTPSIVHTVPTALVGLTVQIQNAKTSLRFLLSQETLYRIDCDKKNNLLFLFLDHSHFIAALPPINYAQSGVHRIEMLNLPNGDLKIIIALNEGIELNKIEMNESAKSPELELELVALPFIKELNAHPTEDATQFGKIKRLVVNMSAEGDYQRALHLSSIGDLDSALLVLKELIVKYPHFNPGRQLLARLLVQTGQRTEAENILQKGSQIQPNYLPFLEMRARLLADRGKAQAALDLLQSTSTPSLSGNADYHALIAALYQRTGQSMMSAKLYEQLLRYDPTRAIWWLGFGIALESLDRKAEASQAYTKANEAQGLTPELQAFVSGRISQSS